MNRWAEELKTALPISAASPSSAPAAAAAATGAGGVVADIGEPIELHHFQSPVAFFGAPDAKQGYELVLDKRVDPASPNNAEGAELLQIWKRPAPGTDPKLGIFQWRSVGTCPVPAETYFNVHQDIEYHMKWDDYIVKLNKHHHDGACQLLYWKTKFPWPLDDRDYALYRRSVVDRHTPNGPYWYGISQSGTAGSLPPVKGTVRVENYNSHFVIRPLLLADGTLSTRACQFAVIAIEDPKIALPQRILNWAIEKALPGVLTKFRQACTSYESWKLKRDNTTPPPTTMATKARSRSSSTTTTVIAATSTTTTSMTSIDGDGICVVTEQTDSMSVVMVTSDDTIGSAIPVLLEPTEGK